MAEVIAVIPARSGSKGVQDKNIKCLAGNPLIAFSIAAAKLTDNIDRVIVSTDSEQYAGIARAHGAEVPFLRPPEISGDCSTDYEWIRNLLDWIQEAEGRQPRYLVHLRPTTPLREVYYIHAAVEKMKQIDSATALRSVHEMSESAYKTLEIDRGYLKAVGSGSLDLEDCNEPRQSFKKTYHGNGYVDIIRSSFVLENKKIHGDRVYAYITPRICEIDTIDDFEYLEYQVQKSPNIVRSLFG